MVCAKVCALSTIIARLGEREPRGELATELLELFANRVEMMLKDLLPEVMRILPDWPEYELREGMP